MHNIILVFIKLAIVLFHLKTWWVANFNKAGKLWCFCIYRVFYFYFQKLLFNILFLKLANNLLLVSSNKTKKSWCKLLRNLLRYKHLFLWKAYFTWHKKCNKYEALQFSSLIKSCKILHFQLKQGVCELKNC